MRLLGGLALVLGMAGSASAGEIVLANGSRLSGELAHEMLLLSTGTGLVEVAADQVAVLSKEELRLRDGRVLKGTLVGGRLRATTALGELTLRADELSVYRAADPVSPPAPSGSGPAPSPAPAGGVTDGSGSPTLAAYQASTAPAPPQIPRAAAQPVTTPAAPDNAASLPGAGETRRLLEVVVGESALYRDAYAAASTVGRVMKGELVAYVDFIDRRLRILDRVIFDGGYWIKVRIKDGSVGWLPAAVLRELR